jgi:hypothetical protein
MKNTSCFIDLIGNAFSSFVIDNQLKLNEMHKETGPEIPFPVFCYIQFSIEYERVNDM